jgi:hypothetical protein
MNNTVMSKFFTKQNIGLLWDVLLDELRIDTNNKQVVTNIRTVFDGNINPFTKNTSVNVNTQLVTLNKQFLSQVVMAVNRLFPNLKQEHEFKRIQISSEELQLTEPYKVEDIHSERQDKFEKQVQQKRIEFEKSINLNKPAEVDFSEKIDDGKIKEMDALIAETVARRKFDIEQIQYPLVTEVPVRQNIIKEDEHVSSELGIYRKLKLKPIDKDTNKDTTENVLKKNVTWTDQKLTNTNKEENISLLIEEYSYSQKKDKVDILTDKVNILIDLMTKITKQLGDKQLDDKQLDDDKEGYDKKGYDL